MNDLSKTAQEQVAWGVDWGKAGYQSCVSIIKRLPNGGIEVLAVEYGPPASKPLTTEQITAGIDLDSMSAVEISAFYAGIRWAEEQHGIGGKA